MNQVPVCTCSPSVTARDPHRAVQTAAVSPKELSFICANRFGVGGATFIMAGDRSKNLLAHDRPSSPGHRGATAGRGYGVPGLAAGEKSRSSSYRRPRAPLSMAGAHLRAYPVCRGRCAPTGPSVGLRVQRVAEPVLLNQLDAAAREAIMDALVKRRCAAAHSRTGPELK